MMKCLFRVLLVSWVFWTVVSFYNFSFLSGLIIPIIWPFLGNSYLQFLPFALLPLVGALVAMVIAMVGLRLVKARPLLGAVVLVNLAFLAAFVGVAELQRAQLMDRAIAEANPDCFKTRSFGSSLASAGNEFGSNPHAVYRKDGRFFVWSYRDLGFFEIPETISRNLNLGQCAVR